VHDMASRLARAQAMRGPRTPQRGVHITLVTGPPCSGKTTYVQQHKQPGDLVIDYDALAVALGSGHEHDHPDTLWPFILTARDAVLDRLTRQHTVRNVWHIKCDPTPADRDTATETVTLAVPAEQCKARATADGRRPQTHTLIDDWWTRHTHIASP
jgi:predicted kinase